MIRRANDCHLWVPYGNGVGMWVRVAHTTAHTIVEDAYEEDCQEIFAYMEGGDLFIGAEGAAELEGSDDVDGDIETEVPAPDGGETETP